MNYKEDSCRDWKGGMRNPEKKDTNAEKTNEKRRAAQITNRLKY